MKRGKKIATTSVSDGTMQMLHRNGITRLELLEEMTRDEFLKLEGARWRHLAQVGRALREHGTEMKDGYCGPKAELEDA